MAVCVADRLRDGAAAGRNPSRNHQTRSVPLFLAKDLLAVVRADAAFGHVAYEEVFAVAVRGLAPKRCLSQSANPTFLACGGLLDESGAFGSDEAPGWVWRGFIMVDSPRSASKTG